MTMLIIGLILLGLGSVVIFFTGLFGTILNILSRLIYDHHKKIRFEQRPGRIFLIRHGESEANVDTSKSTII